MSKKTLNIIAGLCTCAGLLINAFKPETPNPRLNVLIGVLLGLALGIYFANYLRSCLS
jgi:hypothetical protein